MLDAGVTIRKRGPYIFLSEFCTVCIFWDLIIYGRRFWVDASWRMVRTSRRSKTSVSRYRLESCGGTYGALFKIHGAGFGGTAGVW